MPENSRLGKNASRIEIDKAIYRIRQSLEEQYPTPLDFYESPIFEMWKGKNGEKQGPAPVGKVSPTLNTILYGPPGTGKTYATANYCVEICDEKVPESEDEVGDRYDELVKEGRVDFITFHQSYGYEEFVEGLRPETGETESDESGSPGFRLVAEDGVLKRIADRARQSDESPCSRHRRDQPRQRLEGSRRTCHASGGRQASGCAE